MKLKIAEDIRAAFKDVEPPLFEKFLQGGMYSSVDQESVEFLREIHPCADIGQIDRYKLDEILLCLNSHTYSYVIPRMLVYVLENESAMGENFFDGFLQMIVISPKDTRLLIPFSAKNLRGVYSSRKSKYFYSQLTPQQRKALSAAYAFLLSERTVDDDDELIYKCAIDFLAAET